MKQTKGFTLLELIVATTLSLLLVGACAMLFKSLCNIVTTSEAAREIKANIQGMHRQFENDISSAQELLIVRQADDPAGFLEFDSDTHDRRIRYRIVHDAVSRYYLNRETSTDHGITWSGHVLATYLFFENFPALQVEYFWEIPEEDFYTADANNPPATPTNEKIFDQATMPAAIRINAKITDGKKRMTRMFSQTYKIERTRKI